MDSKRGSVLLYNYTTILYWVESDRLGLLILRRCLSDIAEEIKGNATASPLSLTKVAQRQTSLAAPTQFRSLEPRKSYSARELLLRTREVTLEMTTAARQKSGMK